MEKSLLEQIGETLVKQQACINEFKAAQEKAQKDMEVLQAKFKGLCDGFSDDLEVMIAEYNGDTAEEEVE